MSGDNVTALDIARRVLTLVADDNGPRHGEAIAALWAIDAALDADGDYDDRWVCPDCNGVWLSDEDDLTVGQRYQCVECGTIIRATTARPWGTE